MESDEKKLILDLLANQVWTARREGILVGTVYAFSVSFLLFAALSGDPYRLLALTCFMTVIVATVVIWMKLFQKLPGGSNPTSS